MRPYGPPGSATCAVRQRRRCGGCCADATDRGWTGWRHGAYRRSARRFGCAGDPGSRQTLGATVPRRSRAGASVWCTPGPVASAAFRSPGACCGAWAVGSCAAKWSASRPGWTHPHAWGAAVGLASGRWRVPAAGARPAVRLLRVSGRHRACAGAALERTVAVQQRGLVGSCRASVGHVALRLIVRVWRQRTVHNVRAAPAADSLPPSAAAPGSGTAPLTGRDRRVHLRPQPRFRAPPVTIWFRWDPHRRRPSAARCGRCAAGDRHRRCGGADAYRPQRPLERTSDV